jgi:hypothetical protein
MDWLSEIYGIKVERIEIPRPGGAAYYPVRQSGKGVLHTTEGDSIDGAISTFRSKGFAPTFLTGLGRIVQCRPLWAQASTLHTGFAPFYCNAYSQVQIEQVGHSSTELWTPAAGTLHGTVALMAYFAAAREGQAAIPLLRPIPSWEDDGSDLKPIPPTGVRWATNNTRRQSRLFFNGPKGWYAHLEVPDQEPTWHWDCGAIRWPILIDQATKLLQPPGGDDMTEDQVKELVLDLFGVQTESDLAQLEASVKGRFDADRHATSRREFEDPKAQAAYDRAFPVSP